MMLALFGGDEGAMVTAPIPKHAVVFSGLPYCERDPYGEYFPRIDPTVVPPTWTLDPSHVVAAACFWNENTQALENEGALNLNMPLLRMARVLAFSKSYQRNGVLAF